ncbi:MAG: EamA family transporter, partial [Desulfuromonas sp.]
MVLTYLKLLATAAFWGGTFVAGRMLAGVIPPFNAAFLRFAIASAVLLALLFQHLGTLPRLTPKQFGDVLLLGMTGVRG